MRISKENKAWALQSQMNQGEDNPKPEYTIHTHSGLLDLFANSIREQQLTHEAEESIFLQYGTLKNYPANKTIFVKGDVADKIAFIKSGQVRAVVTNPAGDETTLFYMGKANIFGSDSLVPNPVVVVNVETITPCELYMLPAKQFLEIWHKHNFPIQELLAHYLKRISLLSDYICCSHFTNAKQRVVYFLHSYANIHGRTISLTNEQIAAITGANRISVNRILNSLAQENIVKLEYKKIIVLNEEELINIFNGLGYFLD